MRERTDVTINVPMYADNVYIGLALEDIEFNQI